MEEQEIENNEELTVREELNLPNFLDDMSMLGNQIKNKNLIKPPFNYGDLAVTNYILWTILGELMQLNDKLDIK